MCMDYYVDIVTMACDLGVSFIYLADDIGQKGSLIMSPKVTRELTVQALRPAGRHREIAGRSGGIS